MYRTFRLSSGKQSDNNALLLKHFLNTTNFSAACTFPVFASNKKKRHGNAQATTADALARQ
mgnify:CR=1 FL=1